MTTTRARHACRHRPRFAGSPRIVTALACLIAVFGAAAAVSARFDVFPDFAPPHVLVQTEAPGLDATQVEALVTRPLEGLLAGTENVKTVRSTSSQGLSAIQVVFERGGDPYRQRQVVTERLAEFAGTLPQGVGAPLLSPLSSSMEYLVHFGYTSDRLSPVELRDVVQWIVKPQILAVPGVAQAQIFGGEVHERQIDIDPARLALSGFTLDDVLATAKRATALIGGGYLETPTQRIVIQAQAPGAGIDALAGAVLGTREGVPVRLADVATVREGSQPRFGDALIAGRPGILIETSTQFGANTLDVTRALEERLDALAPALAKQGVLYHPALLRPASFIESAIEKLRNSLLIGAVLVVALLLITLRDWRGALVSFSAIPLALLTTVWILEALGMSLNTMTLGGLVVALGVVVDDAVIDVENILRRRRTVTGNVNMSELFISASLEVRRPVFYATAAGRGGVSAHIDDVRIAGRVLPSVVDFLPAGRRPLLAGCDERDAGAMRAGDGGAASEVRGGLSWAPEARAAGRDCLAEPATARARGDCARERGRRNHLSAAAGSALAARFSRELPDRPRVSASRNLAGGDHADRRTNFQEPHGHPRGEKHRRADRPRREWTGSGCAEQERVRGADRPAARPSRGGN